MVSNEKFMSLVETEFMNFSLDERRKFLDVLYFTNLEHKLPLPNQDDFSIKNYDDLDNKTKLAIKEFIFAMSDPDYRETFDLIMNEADEMIDEYKK